MPKIEEINMKMRLETSLDLNEKTGKSEFCRDSMFFPLNSPLPPKSKNDF
jgi:hypothetical protein